MLGFQNYVSATNFLCFQPLLTVMSLSKATLAFVLFSKSVE